MRLSVLATLIFFGCGPTSAEVTGTGEATGTGSGTGTGAGTGSGTGSGTGTGTGAGTGSGTGTGNPVDFAFWSPDLLDSTGDPRAADCDFVLPAQFSCDNSNPEIRWEGVPTDATTLVLIFDDPDAGDFPHWGIYDIPVTETGLDQGISGRNVTNTPPAGAGELTNGFRYEGYLGSCPGNTHIYRWRLYAMPISVPQAPTGDSWSQFATLESWAENNAIDSLEICHIYNP